MGRPSRARTAGAWAGATGTASLPFLRRPRTRWTSGTPQPSSLCGREPAVPRTRRLRHLPDLMGTRVCTLGRHAARALLTFTRPTCRQPSSSRGSRSSTWRRAASSRSRSRAIVDQWRYLFLFNLITVLVFLKGRIAHAWNPSIHWPPPAGPPLQAAHQRAAGGAERCGHLDVEGRSRGTRTGSFRGLTKGKYAGETHTNVMHAAECMIRPTCSSNR